jgi:hypothetical protein
MSTYGKRLAISPKENMPKKTGSVTKSVSQEGDAPVLTPTTSTPKTVPVLVPTTTAPKTVSHEANKDTLVKIELLTINNKPFFGHISDDELIYIWVNVLNRRREELFGVTSTKTLTRNVRATYKLYEPVKIHDVFGQEVFSYRKCLDDGTTEEVTGKILGYGSEKPVKLGELTKITVKTGFGIEASGVINWLKLYGTVASQHGYKTNPETGLKTDVFETEIVLKKHVEEFLPMYGVKAQVHYGGIPRMCNRCYMSGHIRRECNNRKKDWIEFVASLVDGGVDPELLGSWNAAITRWKNANSDPDTRMQRQRPQ